MTSSPSLGEGPRSGPLRIVLSTFPDGESAARVSAHVVERGLAACATAVAARSVYRWKGELEEGAEVLVLFKTSTKKVGALFREVRARHPYEVPELIELETHRVDPAYLFWALSGVDADPKRIARAAGEMRPRAPRSPRGRPRRR